LRWPAFKYSEEKTIRDQSYRNDQQLYSANSIIVIQVARPMMFLPVNVGVACY
jgi:hypothetical protein